MIQKCISQTWTLQEFTETEQLENISLQMRDMKMGPEDRDMANVEESRRRTTRAHRDPGHNSKISRERLCSKCGFEVHLEGKSCPTNGKRCDICLKYNHFAAVCRSEKGRYTQSTDNQVEVTGIKGNIGKRKRLRRIRILKQF